MMILKWGCLLQIFRHPIVAMSELCRMADFLKVRHKHLIAILLFHSRTLSRFGKISDAGVNCTMALMPCSTECKRSNHESKNI